MALLPDERARRAMVRSIDNLTELVTVTQDADEQDANPASFQFEPDDLFALTFSRIGLIDDAAMSAFRVGLKIQLREIAEQIEKMPLAPAVQIGVVYSYVRRELEFFFSR